MSMAPGWYPDPFSSGYLRWWDGQRWTPQTVLSQPHSQTDPSPTAPGAPAAPSAPWPPPASPGYPTYPSYPPAPGFPPAGGYPGYGAPAGGPLVAPFPLASWGSRVGARLIDTLIIGVVVLPIALAMLWPPLRDFVHSLPSNGQAPSAQALTDFDRQMISRILLVSLVSVVVGFAYEVPQLVAYGRTLGKRALGIRVRPLAEDRLPSWKEATIRWAVSAAGSLVGGGLFTLLDDLFPLWDKPWQQAIHDKAAKTIVVPTSS
jgi:uncharacterized RDD family membrane protein YckC